MAANPLLKIRPITPVVGAVIDDVDVYTCTGTPTPDITVSVTITPTGTPTASVSPTSTATEAATATGSPTGTAVASPSATGSTPEEFGSWIAAEIPRWTKVIRAANITAD